MFIVFALLGLGLLLMVALGCTCLVGQMLAGCRQTGEIAAEMTSEVVRRDWQLRQPATESH